jgi:hypothetical protein
MEYKFFDAGNYTNIWNFKVENLEIRQLNSTGY